MPQTVSADGAREAGAVEVFEIAPAGVDLVYLDFVDVETDDVEALFSEGQGEWEADIAEANDADEGALAFDFLEELFSVVTFHSDFSAIIFDSPRTHFNMTTMNVQAGRLHHKGNGDTNRRDISRPYRSKTESHPAFAPDAAGCAFDLSGGASP